MSLKTISQGCRDGSAGKGACHQLNHLSSCPRSYVVERTKLSFDLQTCTIPINQVKHIREKNSVFVPTLRSHQDSKFNSQDLSYRDMFTPQHLRKICCRISIFQGTRHRQEFGDQITAAESVTGGFSPLEASAALPSIPRKAAITRGSEMDCHHRSNLPLRI